MKFIPSKIVITFLVVLATLVCCKKGKPVHESDYFTKNGKFSLSITGKSFSGKDVNHSLDYEYYSNLDEQYYSNFNEFDTTFVARIGRYTLELKENGGFQSVTLQIEFKKSDLTLVPSTRNLFNYNASIEQKDNAYIVLDEWINTGNSNNTFSVSNISFSPSSVILAQIF